MPGPALDWVLRTAGGKSGIGCSPLDDRPVKSTAGQNHLSQVCLVAQRGTRIAQTHRISVRRKSTGCLIFLRSIGPCNRLLAGHAQRRIVAGFCADRRTGGTYMRRALHSRRWLSLLPQGRGSPSLDMQSRTSRSRLPAPPQETTSMSGCRPRTGLAAMNSLINVSGETICGFCGRT